MTKETRREFTDEFEREAAGQRAAADPGGSRTGHPAFGTAALARPRRRCRTGYGCCQTGRRDRRGFGRAGGVPACARGPRPSMGGARHSERGCRHPLGHAEMRFRLIEDRREAFPVQAMCSVPGVSTGGYYAWRGRPESARAGANRALVEDERVGRIHTTVPTQRRRRVVRRPGRARTGRDRRRRGRPCGGSTTGRSAGGSPRGDGGGAALRGAGRGPAHPTPGRRDPTPMPRRHRRTHRARPAFTIR